MLSKEKFDLEVHSNDKAKGLSMRERTSEKEGTNRRNTMSKSRGCKSNKLYKYCKKPGHLAAECYKLKNKKEKEEKNNQPTEASVVDSGSDGDALLVTTMDN